MRIMTSVPKSMFGDESARIDQRAAHDEEAEGDDERVCMNVISRPTSGMSTMTTKPPGDRIRPAQVAV